jgi:uncharacterized metal-binding protein YceD (DUF177 family)
MKPNKDFDIEFVGLKLGLHDFEYKIENTFFQDIDFIDFNSINVVVKVKLVKKTTLLELNLESKGSVELNCDITNELFNQSVNNSFDLVVNFGQEFNNENEEILILPHSEHKLNIEQLIYELVTLSIPQKRIHPGVLDGSLESDILDKLNELSPKENVSANKGEIDPRCEKLKKIVTDK